MKGEGLRKAITRKGKFVLPFLLLLLVLYIYCLPKKLFTDPYSTVLIARNGELLSAQIADDGQWRFPAGEEVPEKFAQALIAFEDKRFYDHPGVDLMALGRAFNQNVRARKVVSGGSTITMQVLRLSRKNKSRSVIEKCIEMILATRLEIRHSKSEILRLYASHAPFGGNVVGLQAACWRYFGTNSEDLSWAQACMLAVLPNSPSLMHPGKNRAALKLKRDRLLKKLWHQGVIDQFTYELALEEPIPDEPHPLPRHARHLLLRMNADGLRGTMLQSTVDFPAQQQVERILEQHHLGLSSNQINNCAALVIEVASCNVVAYAGNIQSPGLHESEVDIISSARSTGSILKPFLYAAMMDEGKLLPKMLLHDAPFVINGFAPKNFSMAYDGAVPADKALVRSLNVPAVHLLREYRYEKFHTLLKSIGMTTLDKPPIHYGLSLILGGAEGTLWDITGMYASLARAQLNYFKYPGKYRYSTQDYRPPRYQQMSDSTAMTELLETAPISAASTYLIFESLTELKRPGEESGWRYFNSAQKIAWKTGTSFGFRDGWAVGVTPKYVVGVWAGNADGEGRPGLTGTDAAAPILFDIFSHLPDSETWFSPPTPEMKEVTVCVKSGHRASPHCEDTETMKIHVKGTTSRLCPYHRQVHLSADLKYQVNAECTSLSAMKHINWFVLPPVQEHYFKKVNIFYKSLPPYRDDCSGQENIQFMDMVYPKNNAVLFIPRELDGIAGRSVFELAHRNPNATVFWHLDGNYIGTTNGRHSMALSPSAGKHNLTVVDEEGRIIERRFEVISKSN